jgi:uncharacterized membrane protein YkoI
MQRPSSNRALVVSALPLLLALGACSSTGSLGGVPDDLVDLYDAVRPGGVMELEVDRDGSIREMEAEIPVESLPPAIVAAARARYPQARITGAERELTRAGAGWEVKLEHEGSMVELVYDEDAELLELERELRRSEAPSVVLEAAKHAITGGTFKSVEVIEQGDEQLYHVKLEKDGMSYKVVLTPEGEVTRKVREQRAEIEIPLR